MVVYSFYRRKNLVKANVTSYRKSCIPGEIQVFIDRETEFRKDKTKNALWMTLSINEGEIRFGKFWLEHEDDERANKIYENYKKQKRKTIMKQLEKLES